MSPILVVETLVKRFGGVAAIDGCSLSVPRGSVTGLIGPNGAGKTTLFNVVAGAMPPDSGRVRLDDADITGMPTHQLFARGLVRTFRIPNEYSRMTVVENLMVVPPRQSGERLAAALFRPRRCGARTARSTGRPATCWRSWVWRRSAMRRPAIFPAGRRNCWSWAAR